MSETNPAPRSVLVYVGTDLVGDGIMKLPFLRALRQACPDARITWLAGKYASAYAHELAPLVAGLVNEVIERAGFERTLHWVFRRPLPDRRFDLIIDTQRGVIASLILRRVRHGCFVSGAADFLLSDVRPARGYRRPAAMVGQLLDLLALATGRATGLAPTLGAAPGLDDTAVTGPAERALPAGPVYVGLAPGAGGQHKCWPLENFIALAREQIAHGRVPVFILGPQEEGWTGTLRAAVPEAVFPSDGPDGAAGGERISRSPLFTIAVAARLAAAVTNDSGAGHLIAAADVPMVSLFGPTRPEKFAPTASRLIVLSAQSFGRAEMDAIPVEAAARAVDALLAHE